MNHRKEEIVHRPTTKFEVKIEYTVTETYEVNAKDAEVARWIAERGTMAPVNREVRGKNTISVKKVGPRYMTEHIGPERFVVRDTFQDEVVATARYVDVANTLVNTLNAKEEEK